MRRALAIVSAFLLALGAVDRPPASAAASEVLAPAPELEDDRAGMCDAFEGLAFTFCVAVCEARDCDVLAMDDARCAILRRGFGRAAGGAQPPCLEGTAPARAL